MPPKPRVTKEIIVKGAFDLIREKGEKSLNARSLSSFLGSSTQPILYQFSTMEEVITEAYRIADEFHSNYLLSDLEEEENPLLSLGLRYIRFASEEKNLFLFLFQSERLKGNFTSLFNDQQLIPILETIGGASGLEERDVKRLFFPLFSAVHGNASLLANNAVEYDEEETKEMLNLLFTGLFNEIEKEKEDGKED